MNQNVVRAYEGRAPYIFVSYAHKDAAQVLPVIAQLQSYGYRIWYDEGIAPGSEWPENIAVHLNNCAAVIAFLSPNSVNSSNCRREITYALSKNKPFLGIFLTETAMSPGMEMQISSQQCVMKYAYRDLSLFYEKVCSFGGLYPCKTVQQAQPSYRQPTPAQTYCAQPNPAQTYYTQPVSGQNVASGQLGMRQLTIHRLKATVAGITEFNVYIEDNAAGDLKINGVLCRKLGTIANGEIKTFLIPTTAARVYVFAKTFRDRLGKNLINEFYPLPAGVEPVQLRGKCSANLLAGMHFRFEGVQDRQVLRNRRRSAMWSWIIVAAVLALGILGNLLEQGVFDGTNQAPSLIFQGSEYKITLTEDFKKITYEGYDSAFESKEVFIPILVERFQDVPELRDYTSYEYADSVLRANGKQCEVKSYKDFLYFEYVSTSKVSGEDMHYFVTIHKSEEAFWIVQFITAEKNYSKYRESFLKWADTFAPNT